MVLQVTGALRTTVTNALNVHADLLPMKLLVDKICIRSILRMATLPKSHSMHTEARKAARGVK
jgi:hypothetical protein